MPRPLKDLEVFNARDWKWIVAALIAFIACGVVSFNEARYRLWSQPTTATIVNIQQNRKATSNNIQSTDVTYTFTDPAPRMPEAATRTETDRISGDYPPLGTKTLDIQFIPGSPGRSRAVVNASGWIVFVLFAIMLGIAIVVVTFTIQYYRDQAERDRKGR